ncbi:helix-turn-helix domain-containing protein [Streptomyces sp. NPDC054884]
MGALGHGNELDELLRLVRRQRPAEEVLQWLGRRIGAEAAWVGYGGAVDAATPGLPGEVVSALRERVERLADGRLAAATTRWGEVEVRLEAFGVREPRPVLVTASASALSRKAAELASTAGNLLELLGRAREADDKARQYDEKAKQLRFAVMTALMTGDVTLARRMTSGAVPRLLNAERVSVQLLHCPPAERHRLIRAHQDSSGYHGPGLWVPCPSFDNQLICLTADPEPDGNRPHGEILRRLVRENPGYALGVGRPRPLAATGEAYAEAMHALAVARNSPERLAVYRDQPSLVHLLPRPAALVWARALVGPLSSVQKQTVDITRLALTFPRSAVARLLQITRHTVAAHCHVAEQALGLDFGDVRTRAALDLALSLADLPADPFAPAWPATPTLGELLRSEPAVAWAETLLRPLDEARHRALGVTARAWIDANTDARRTAEHLGLSRNTVRARLRTVERLLGRDLLTTRSGIHDLVHALSVTGDHRALSADEFDHRAH